jgi:hypothetical protein
MVQEHVESFHGSSHRTTRRQFRHADRATAKRATPRPVVWWPRPADESEPSQDITHPGCRCRAAFSPSQSWLGLAFLTTSPFPSPESNVHTRHLLRVLPDRIEGPPPLFTPVKLFHFARSLLLFS